MTDKVTRTEEQWRMALSPEQYRVLRQKGTEPAFSGAYHDHEGRGIYACAACNQPLFSSEAKFDSGTGWPSYTKPIDDSKIAEAPDHGHGMIRTEVLCSQCGSHLGHVFDDGPPPIGKRYCINSIALDFKKAEQP